MRQSVLTLALALASSALVADTAAAEAGFVVSARPSGLQWLAEQARGQLPTELDFPPFETTLYDCPLTHDDMEAAARNVSGRLDVRTLELLPREDALVVRARLDFHADAFFDIENVYACTDDAFCDVRVNADDIGVTLKLGLRSTDSGRTHVSRTDLTVDIDPSSFELDSDGCFVGDAAEWAFELVEAWALERIMPRVESFAAESITEQVQEAIDGLGVQTIEQGDFRLRGWLDGVDINHRSGLTVRADASIESLGEGAANEAEHALPRLPARSVEPLSSEVEGSFALAVSDQRVTDALYEAWRTGLLQRLAADATGEGLELDPEGMAAQLGLPAGTIVTPSVRLAQPPRAAFGRGSDFLPVSSHVALTLPELHVRVDIESPDAPPGRLEAVLAATASVRATLDPERGALRLVPERLEVHRLDVTTPAERFRLDPARLARLVSTVAMPRLRERLAAIPLALTLSPVDGLFVIARHVSGERGWLRIGVDVHRPTVDDGGPPNTWFVDPPSVVGAGMAAFHFDGSDRATPDELLAFEVLVDGEPLGPPAYLREAWLSESEGEHTVEVRAIDLDGRVDPTPARHDFVVDGTPPILELLEVPPRLIKDETPVARWRAEDDRGTVATRWELRRVEADGSSTVVDEDGLKAHRTEVRFERLRSASPAGTQYVLEVVAEDEGGNVTSEATAFSILGTPSSCAVAAPGLRGHGLPGHGLPFGALLFVAALLGFGFARRRRRSGTPHRGRLTRSLGVLAVTVAVSSSFGASSAQAQGTPISGATVGDGAAPYWNPAAMNETEGTRVDVAAQVSLIRPSFESAVTGGVSTTRIPKPGFTLGFVSDALADRVRFGLTAGLFDTTGAAWDVDDGAGDITRYYAHEGKTFYLGAVPALSVRLAPWLSVGAGLMVVRGQLDAVLDKDMGARVNETVGSGELDSPLPYGDPDLASPATLHSSGWGVGGVFGILVAPHETLRLGVGVQTKVRISTTGSIDLQYSERVQQVVRDVAPAAELPELSGRLDVPLALPLKVTAGVSFSPSSEWDLRLDYRFHRDRDTRSLDILISEATSDDLNSTYIPKDFRNTHAVLPRIIRHFADGRFSLGAHGRYETSTVPEVTHTPSEMDFVKGELGLLGAWRASERCSLMLYYSHWFIRTRTIDESVYGPSTEPALDALNRPSPTGRYSTKADTVGLSVTGQF